MFIPASEYVRLQEMLPILCVDAVITHENKCLLLIRRNNPARGQLWFPGGRLYKNETIQSAAIRKAFQEVGLRCQFQSILSVEETLFPRVDDMLTDVHTVNVCCHLSITELSEIVIDSNHSGFQWVDENTAEKLPLHEGVRRPLLIALTGIESAHYFREKVK